MSHEFNVRALVPQDWQAFKDIRLLALQSFPGNYGAKYKDESVFSDQAWAERLNDNKNRIFGLFHHEKLIGTNGVFTFHDDPEGKTAILVMWFMQQEYRGQGLFNGLVRAGIEWAERQPHFERICVNHRDGNDSSRAANQKNGFVYIGREPWTWPDGETVDLCMYERKIVR